MGFVRTTVAAYGSGSQAVALGLPSLLEARPGERLKGFCRNTRLLCGKKVDEKV